MNRALYVIASPYRWLKGLYRWVVGWADRPGSVVALGTISFAEASFFPIPPDPLLWALCIGARKRSYWFATVTTVASVAGGVFGWVLGRYLFGDVVVWTIEALHAQSGWFGTAESLRLERYAGDGPIWANGVRLFPDGYLYRAHVLFEEWGFFALFVAALTPIPYKVATIASGLFQLSPLTVIAGSMAGRGMRFYAFAALFRVFGDKAKEVIERYFGLLTIIFVLLLVAGFYLIKYVLA